ncbi:MAG: ChaN family lipoprotein [Gemmatimonadaceae bacterium]
MSPFARLILLALAVFWSGACMPAPATVAPPPSPASSYRVIDSRALQETTFGHMAARLSRSKVVFFGEQHDDPGTHAAKLELLEAIGRSGRPVIVSLEMFERDIQPALDDYLAGRVSESEFMAGARPWPRYVTDYRPLVELAKARGWRAIASNVPRPIASAVGRAGLGMLDTLAAGRAHAARDISCPRDDYRARFLAETRTHTAGSGAAPQPGDTLPTAVAERFYLAQCVKDETMAESIVDALRRAPRNAIAVHFNGSFHSDYGQGVADRVRRREPRWNLGIVTAVPARDPAIAPVAPHAGRADFLIFTLRRD